MSYRPRSRVQRGRDTEHRLAASRALDPRTSSTPYRWSRMTPHRIQAYRSSNEMPGLDRCPKAAGWSDEATTATTTSLALGSSREVDDCDWGGEWGSGGSAPTVDRA